MISQTKETTDLRNPVLHIVNDFDTDLFLFSSLIDYSATDNLINQIKKLEHQRKNLGLILTTRGGYADPTFMLARFLKRQYNNQLTFYIFGTCKSAGTILALAANKIVMSDFGELGPLDVQSVKEEDIRWESGLTSRQAVKLLAEQACEMYRICLAGVIRESRKVAGDSISLQTAEDLASSIVTKLLKPIAGKMEPMRMGEMERAIQIVKDYGSLLNPEMEKSGALEYLVTGYPSHDFVIDYEEAQRLFGDSGVTVTQPTELEQALERFLLEQKVPIRWEGNNEIYNLTDRFASPEESDNSTHNGHSPEEASKNGAGEVVAVGMMSGQ